MAFYLKKLLAFIGIILVSCGQGNKEGEKEKTEKTRDLRAELMKKNIQKSKSLSERYSAISGWDTVRQYTYQLQELFANNIHPISFTGTINDIIKRDSNYVLKLYSYFDYSYAYHMQKYSSFDYLSRIFIAEVELSSLQLRELKELIKSKKHEIQACFIFNVTKIESSFPELTAYCSDNGEKAYLRYDFDEPLINIKGNLIAFYVYEDLRDTD